MFFLFVLSRVFINQDESRSQLWKEKGENLNLNGFINSFLQSSEPNQGITQNLNHRL